MSLNYRNTEDSVSQAGCACHILVRPSLNKCLFAVPLPCIFWLGRYM